MTQTKTCLHCQTSFEITQSDMDFYDKISPTFAGEKFALPSPTLCPDCRQRRRLSFRNERKLYKSICSSTKQAMVSIYHPESDYTVYNHKIWRSDMRDPMDYAMDFDFTRSFTERYGSLMKRVPMCSIYNINSENSEYTNICAYNKNCYMLVESSNNEDCYHGYRLQKSQFCVDCSMCNFSQYCYASIDLENCYMLARSQYCRDCKNSYLLENCVSCEYCFACVGLEHKKYMIYNKQSTKEEYESIVKAFLNDEEQRVKYLVEFHNLAGGQKSYSHIRNSQNVTGDYIIDAQDIRDSYEIHDAKNIAYSKHVRFNSGDCMDVDTVGYNSFMMYESINTALDAFHNICCMRCRSGCKKLLYCYNCDNCSDCFGCIGLRNKQYCIFNKQYSKEDYEIMVGKIIRHMMQPRRDALSARPSETFTERGEFFHPSLSPFGYNETVAQEYYPIEIQNSKLQIQNGNIDYSVYGYHRSTYVAPTPQVDKVIRGQDLPDTIDDISDDILKMAVLCEISNKPFRITPQELVFYRKHHIPLPRKHPDVRHEERMRLRR